MAPPFLHAEVHSNKISTVQFGIKLCHTTLHSTTLQAVLGQELFLLNLYFTEDGLVLGGVTHRCGLGVILYCSRSKIKVTMYRRVLPEWLDISTGHLVDR